MKEKSNNFIKCELNSYPDFAEHIVLKWNTVRTLPYRNVLSTYFLQSQNFSVTVKITYYTKVHLLLQNHFIVSMRQTTHIGAKSRYVSDFTMH